MAHTLLRGRIRVSTCLLALAFLVTLSTYLLVRPPPATGVSTGTTAPVTSAPSSRVPRPTSPSPRHAPSPSPSPVPPPSHRPGASPSPDASPAGTSAAPTPSPT